MKRFLSLFAIVALIVSMFSGVAFAAAGAGDDYTFTATPNTVAEGLDTTVNISTATNDGGAGTIDVADLDGLSVGIYNAAGTLQKNSSNTDITAAINAGAGTAAFTDTDIADLAVGTYYVKLTSGTDGDSGNGENQYINVSNAGFDAAEDAEVVVATLKVLPNVKVVLDSDDNIKFTEKFGTVTLTGKIIDVTSGALRKVDSTIKIVKDNGATGTNANDGVLQDEEHDADNDTVVSADAVDGVFSITVETTAAGQYFAISETDTEAYYDNTTVAYDTFRILSDIELSSPEALEWNFPASGQVVVQGVFPNEDNAVAKENIELAYIGTNDDKDTSIAVSNFADAEAFGFLFNADKLVRVGKVGIYVNDVLAIEGEVKAGDLDVTMSPDTVSKALGYQTITFDFELDSKYVNATGDDMAATYSLRYSVEDADENAVKADKNDNNDASDDDTDLTNTAMSAGFTNDTDEKYELDLYCGSWDAGNYTIKVELYHDNAVDTKDTVVLTKTFDLTVSNPAAYTVTGWALEEASVGDVVIQLPDNSGVATSDLDDNSGVPAYAAVAGDDEQVSVTKYSNSTYSYPKYVEVIANGAGVDNKTYANFGDDIVTIGASGEYLATIPTTETGTLTLTVNVYFEATAGGPESTKAYSFTKEIEIKGWNVEITPSELLVDSEENITFTITDEDGNPVNNAIVKIGTTTVVDGTATNIVGGVYTYEEDDQNQFGSVGTLEVSFWKDGGSTAEVTLSSGIEVLGEEVYTVTSDTPVLLNGIDQDIYVTVLDENGDIVYPTFESIDVDEDGDETAGDNPTVGSRSDLDGDGVKEAVKLTVTPNHDQVGMIIRASTDSGEKMGEVKLEVQMPQVIMTGANKVSQDYNTTLQFTVVDPRDNSVLDKDFYLKGLETYLVDGFAVEDSSETTVLVTDNGDNRTSANLTENDDNVYEYKVFVDMVDWDTAEDDEKDVTISLNMSADSATDTELLTIPVAKATLTSDPEMVIINSATNMTLTLADADGNALEGYKVNLDGQEIGETDAEGKVVYAASATSSLSLDFTATTDDSDEDVAIGDVTDSKVIEKKVKSTADTQAPVVSAPATVTGNTVVITIKDNVRVSKILVNGTPVDLFFPMPEVSHIANVNPGVNTFKVQAIDINNNYVDTTVEVTVEKTVEPVNFTIGEATEYGVPELKSETTMVPVRFAEDLGATVAWDNATQTVTYQLGETEISMTIGSKTAVVKGENTQLTVAPYLNDAGRTMVPLRMIAQELGFTVNWTSNSAPISIE